MTVISKAAVKIVLATSVAVLPIALAACPSVDEVQNSSAAKKPGAVLAKVQGVAVAPMSQLTTVAPLTTIAPLTTVAPFRVAGEDAMGQQGFVPNGKITVLDGNMNPVPDLGEATTDDKGNFTLHLPTGRAFILKLEFGTQKKITLYAFVKPSETGGVSLKLNVPGTLAAHLLLSKIAQRPGLLNEFTNEELDPIIAEITNHLTPEDVPDLTQITSILDRVSKIEARLAALEDKVSELEKKVDVLLQGGTPASPSPTPTASPSPSPSPSASPTQASKQLGAFALAGTSLTSRRTLHVCANTGQYLYAIGGYFGPNPVQASVERAAISNGTLGMFEPAAGVGLVTPRGQSSAFVGSKYVYVLGGDCSSGILGNVERAAINSDGSLGNFAAVSDVNLVTPRRLAASAAIGGYVYLFGGTATTISATTPTFLSSVERAKINADGTLGTFSLVPGVNLTANKAAATCTVIGKYVYLIGGQGMSGVVSTVERAPINDDGSIGQFSAIPNVRLVSTRNQHAAFVFESGLYVVGGFSGGTWLKTVERAPINADGTIGTFALSNRSLMTGREGHAVALIGDKAFVIGGSNSLINNTSGVQGSIEVATFQ